MPKHPPKKSTSSPDGVSRRDFLSSAGIGTLGLVATPAVAQPTASEPVAAAGERLGLSLSINGRVEKVMVEPRWTLVDVLREELGLTGTKRGCGRGECGSCTVLFNDTPRYACMTLAIEAQGVEITTVEGLMDGEDLGAVQAAFAEDDAFQCGYCTSGQIMAVEGLLRAQPDPTPEAIRKGVSGNLCRCGAYPNIFRAASRAGRDRRREEGSK